MEQTGQVPTPTPPIEMGAGSRLVNVFFSPGRTFESIGRKPGSDWIVPVILVVLLGIVGSFVITPKIDVDAAVREQISRIEKRSPNLTDQQRGQVEESVRKNMGFFVQGGGRFIGPFFALIPIFLVPAIYHGIAAAAGKKTGYVNVLAGYSYVQMVQVLKGVLMIVVALPRKTIDLAELQIGGLLKSNLAAFLDPETTSRPLLALASNIDVLELWALALGIVALPRVTRLSTKAATLTVVGLWILWVLILVGLATLGQAFGG